MSVTIDVRYLGELRCEATHRPSGSRIEIDAPTDNHGRGERFSPSDSVAMALGSCMLILMGITAQRHDLDIAGARATVVKEMVVDPVRRIGRLTVRIELPHPLAAEQLALLERAALTCPVASSLDPRIEKRLIVEVAT